MRADREDWDEDEGPPPRTRGRRVADLLLAYLPALLSLVVQVALLVVVGKHWWLLGDLQARWSAPSADAARESASLAHQIREDADELRADAEVVRASIADAKELRGAVAELHKNVRAVNESAAQLKEQAKSSTAGRPGPAVEVPVVVVLGASAASGTRQSIVQRLLKEAPDRRKVFYSLDGIYSLDAKGNLTRGVAESPGRDSSDRVSTPNSHLDSEHSPALPKGYRIVLLLGANDLRG